MAGLHERSKLFQTLYAAGSLAAMALFLRWVLYGSAPEYSRFRNFKPRPREERNLRPLLAGPAEGFYWPPNVREANIEELLERRMQLSREMWQREGMSVTAEDLIRNGGKAAAAKQGTGGRGDSEAERERARVLERLDVLRAEVQRRVQRDREEKAQAPEL